jgi:hypothetical protein
MTNHSNESAEPSPTATIGYASLVEEGPRALLDRLIDGDPLEMRALVHARLAERSLLWDEEALCLRALALCAHQTVVQRRRRLDREWLLGIVDRSIEQLALLGEDMSDGNPAAGFAVFGLPLNFEPSAVRRACLALNRMGDFQRRCFRALLIDGRDLDAVAHELGRDGGAVGRGAREALDKYLGAFVSPMASPCDH